MPYVTMNEMLADAHKKGYAVGAFNIFNYQSIRAAIAEAEAQRSPIILQTSVKTVKAFGSRELARILIPLAEKAAVPVALHLDHCKDIAFAKECMDAGWSSIMYDGSSFPFEENIRSTKEVVAYKNGHDISVEGELGAIVGVEEEIIVNDEDGSLADTRLSVRYVSETGIDAFAPAIGTAHGVYRGEPKLDFGRFAEIESLVRQPLVIHGGTGLSPEVFRRFIQLGATKINISTALKLSYIQALTECGQFKEPLAADEHIENKLRGTVAEHIRIFGSDGKS